MSFYPYTYAAAKAYLEGARDPESGRPIQNNTRLHSRVRRTDDSANELVMAVKLHNTDVVTYRANGNVIIATGGWETVTTRDRITGWSNVRIQSHEGTWYIQALPKASDPEPEVRLVSIPKPFVAHDPGPEPVDNGDGCIAGTSTERQRTTKRWRDELEPGDRLIEESGTGAFRFLVEYDFTEVTHWGEHYSFQSRGINHRNEVCPHCLAFTKARSRWYTANSEWRTYSEQMELHGSMAAWADARKEANRERRAQLKAHREWWARNFVPIGSGVECNADGYVLRSEAEAHFKTERRMARAARAAERRREAELKRQRGIERLRERSRRNRVENDPVARAHRITATLAEMRQSLQTLNES